MLTVLSDIELAQSMQEEKKDEKEVDVNYFIRILIKILKFNFKFILKRVP
jgi:hypothetical protein